MESFVPYLILFGIVFGVNLMPAFGPPTWSIIVLYGLNSDLPTHAIILVGALAAASGRLVLAHAFRLLGTRVSEKTRANLTAAREAFERNRKGGIVALGLFALSPVPSAQLFEAAGLAGVRLLGFTTAFFAGRIVSYSIYAYSAKEVRQSSFGDVLAGSISSPLGVGLQLAMIGALIAFARIDWAKLIARRKGEG